MIDVSDDGDVSEIHAGDCLSAGLNRELSGW